MCNCVKNEKVVIIKNNIGAMTGGWTDCKGETAYNNKNTTNNDDDENEKEEDAEEEERAEGRNVMTSVV